MKRTLQKKRKNTNTIGAERTKRGKLQNGKKFCNRVKTKQEKYLQKKKRITETQKEIRKYKTEKRERERSITGKNNTKTL